MEYISLLWPSHEMSFLSKTKKLNSETADSLNLDELCNCMAKRKEDCEGIKAILTNLCCDEEVIRYRQEIFSDLMNSEPLIQSIENIVEQLEQLQYMSIQSSMEEPTLWKLFSKFKELDSYTTCVTVIGQGLQGMDFKSRGLCQLRDALKNIYEDKDFIALSQTLRNLSIELNEIRSLNIGVNLDSSLNPVEATLVSVNKTRYIDNTWFSNIMLATKGLSTKDLGLISKIHPLSQDKRQPIMYNLYKDIESLLKPVLKDMSTGLKRYSNIQGQYLVDLIPEMTFYLSCVRLCKSMKENNMPYCIPQIARMEERKCIVNNAYNINLALHMLKNKEKPEENLVLNELYFNDSGRIFLLTGPNRGGKTVYTETIGLAQVLFQAGIFVPGSGACMSPVDAIYSHFPVDENQTVELGRLGEETKRLNEIFQSATRYSLILLNESLSSTSFSEALYIAQDVVKAIRYLGARAVFNTHMHELASYADMMNQEVQGDSKVVSLVTGMVEGKRSYIVKPGAPLGKSYAMDIARKHGISFEQIMQTLENRKNGSFSTK